MADVSGLGGRLQAVRGKESLDAFAQQLEVHRNTLFRYEKGESYPDARIIYMLRTKFDVNPNWLISGDGAMHISDGQDATAQDIDTLEKFIKILDGLEFVLDKMGREARLDIKKGWIRYLYKRLRQLKPSEITRVVVEELIIEVDKLNESKKGDV